MNITIHFGDAKIADDDSREYDVFKCNKYKVWTIFCHHPKSEAASQPDTVKVTDEDGEGSKTVVKKEEISVNGMDNKVEKTRLCETNNCASKALRQEEALTRSLPQPPKAAKQKSGKIEKRNGNAVFSILKVADGSESKEFFDALALPRPARDLKSAHGEEENA